MLKKLILTILILNISCSVSTDQENKISSSPTSKRELKKEIPDAGWVKIYFGEDPNLRRPGLDKIATQNGFSILRETLLPEDDLEVRIWVGFGKFGKDGLILKRDSGNWFAINIRGMLCHLEDMGKYKLESPKSGWEGIWKNLVDEGLLNLPDSSEIEYENGVLDGKSFVIETNVNDTYRTYEYGNPRFENVKEAKQIMKIGEIIADEFGLESFSGEVDGCKINEY